MATYCFNNLNKLNNEHQFYHVYNTRNRDRLRPYHHRNSLIEKSFLVQAPIIWNDILDNVPNITNSPSLSSFKKKYKTYLLSWTFLVSAFSQRRTMHSNCDSLCPLNCMQITLFTYKPHFPYLYSLSFPIFPTMTSMSLLAHLHQSLLLPFHPCPQIVPFSFLTFFIVLCIYVLHTYILPSMWSISVLSLFFLLFFDYLPLWYYALG